MPGQGYRLPGRVDRIERSGLHGLWHGRAMVGQFLDADFVRAKHRDNSRFRDTDDELRYFSRDIRGGWPSDKSGFPRSIADLE